MSEELKACERWLSSEDPEKVAQAMGCCEDASSECITNGNCSFEGACFDEKELHSCIILA